MTRNDFRKILRMLKLFAIKIYHYVSHAYIVVIGHDSASLKTAIHITDRYTYNRRSIVTQHVAKIL